MNRNFNFKDYDLPPKDVNAGGNCLRHFRLDVRNPDSERESVCEQIY